MTDDRVVVSAPSSAVDHLDDLSPLWCQMQEHQIAVAHHRGLNRDLVAGWQIRRSWYVDELAKGGAIIRASRGDRLVGYCAVSLQLVEAWDRGCLMQQRPSLDPKGLTPWRSR